MAELRERGYLRFEGFLNADELVAAQEGVWLHYPRPEEYFADPAAYAWPATDQWAGIIRGAWKSWNLNRLAFHPDLLDLAERFLCSAGSLDSVRRVRPRRSQLMTQVLPRTSSMAAAPCHHPNGRAWARSGAHCARSGAHGFDGRTGRK